MVAIVLQIVAVMVFAIYLILFRRSLLHRNAQTWESLARLRPGWRTGELSSHFLYNEGLTSTPEETWTSMPGSRGLWVVYHNANVMLEMADFAARNWSAVDSQLLATLRSDAVQIRICVLTTIVSAAFFHPNQGVRINAFRAASMYTGMVTRMAQVLQETAAVMVPAFVAAA